MLPIQCVPVDMEHIHKSLAKKTPMAYFIEKRGHGAKVLDLCMLFMSVRPFDIIDAADRRPLGSRLDLESFRSAETKAG